MPAVLRGGGRSVAKPRAKTPRKSRTPRGKGAPQGASKLRAAQKVGLSPGFAVAGATAVLAAGLIVALATGHRAERLAAATTIAVETKFGSAGFRLRTVHLQGASRAAEADILKAADVHRDQP